ncbi:neurosecretory protein VGF-like [Clarias magur]|uniref:Neurosecretory protein VGF-like n=1 Tax=Clarias magur TaxID=1594786 RepID=A0A8J4UV83_CLAMG|nr:neurosecretory protein VGF-like [Clarias magur]
MPETDSSAFFEAFREKQIVQDEQNQRSSESKILKQAELQKLGLESEPQEHFEMSQEKLLTGEEIQKQSEPKKQPTATESLELCYYCIKSHSMAEHNTGQMELESKALMPPYGGDRLSYQQDPRPHFGVARSSRSTAFPLWDSEEHREMKREADEADTNSISNCPRCHLGLCLDTLRWHVVNKKTL